MILTASGLLDFHQAGKRFHTKINYLKNNFHVLPLIFTPRNFLSGLFAVTLWSGVDWILSTACT